MKLVKKQSDKTYKNKDNKEVHYYNYYVVADNGKSVLIKPVNSRDYALLNFISEYVK